jgi:tetrathionate reductase subunit B
MATKKRYGFVIDVSRCIDCRACLVACSVENQVGMKYTRIWVRDLGVQGDYPALRRAFVPYNCMHCDNPPCIQVCASGATYKNPDNGLVLVDQEACIGCGYCVDACPYEARYLDNERGVVDKCTGCVQRLEAGQPPACVATCVGRARMFGDLNDPASEAALMLKGARTVQRLDYQLADGSHTGPNVYFINGDVQDPALAPRAPQYTAAESTWRSVLAPAVLAGLGLSFLGQATFFTKQLLEGEKEFDE